MPLQLAKLDAYPNEIVATKVDSFVPGGSFFLDFSRPLQRVRWLGLHNRFIGVTTGLFVPVVHEGERTGGYVVSSSRGDPYFSDIQALWAARYPSKRAVPATEAGNLQIVGDFASQFPEDSR